MVKIYKKNRIIEKDVKIFQIKYSQSHWKLLETNL
jgi:hypothetical protein